MDGETEAQREERLKSLWRQLDTKRKGYLDLPALKEGLQKMNHREPVSFYYAGEALLIHVDLQRSKMQMDWSGICSRPAISITTGR